MLDMSYVFPGLVTSLQSPCSQQNFSVLEVTFLFVEMMVVEFALCHLLFQLACFGLQFWLMGLNFLLSQ